MPWYQIIAVIEADKKKSGGEDECPLDQDLIAEHIKIVQDAYNCLRRDSPAVIDKRLLGLAFTNLAELYPLLDKRQ